MTLTKTFYVLVIFCVYLSMCPLCVCSTTCPSTCALHTRATISYIRCVRTLFVLHVPHTISYMYYISNSTSNSRCLSKEIVVNVVQHVSSISAMLLQHKYIETDRNKCIKQLNTRLILKLKNLPSWFYFFRF